MKTKSSSLPLAPRHAPFTLPHLTPAEGQFNEVTTISSSNKRLNADDSASVPSSHLSIPNALATSQLTGSIMTALFPRDGCCELIRPVRMGLQCCHDNNCDNEKPKPGGHIVGRLDRVGILVFDCQNPRRLTIRAGFMVSCPTAFGKADRLGFQLRPWYTCAFALRQLAVFSSLFLQFCIESGYERIREKMCRAVFISDVFYTLCNHAYGSYFMQKMVDRCHEDELVPVVSLLRGCFAVLCCGYYSTHLMQRLWDKFDTTIRLHLLDELKGVEVNVTIDQCGTHVIVKMIESMNVFGYGQIIHSITSSSSSLRIVAENAYGSHVLEVALKKLESEAVCCGSTAARTLLRKTLFGIVTDCEHFACHPFANYIVQQVIVSPFLGEFSTAAIRMLRGKLLRLSQEKYASHVIEKAFSFGSTEMLYSMMEEMLDGYECGSDGFDAVGVMLTDLFGNYVVQKMFDVAIDVLAGRREGSLAWYDRLVLSINVYRNDLQKYASGKRILQKLKFAQEALGKEVNKKAPSTLCDAAPWSRL